MSSNHPFEHHPFTPKSPSNYWPRSTSHWSAPDKLNSTYGKRNNWNNSNRYGSQEKKHSLPK